MSFRFPMAVLFGAMLAFACTPKTTDKTDDTDTSDTDVVDTNDTVVDDTDVVDTDPVECDVSDTDTTGDCATCAPCVANTTCSTEGDACKADTECNALFTCVIGCGTDETCFEGCSTDHPTGLTLFNPLRECIGTECPNSCK